MRLSKSQPVPSLPGRQHPGRVPGRSAPWRSRLANRHRLPAAGPATLAGSALPRAGRPNQHLSAPLLPRNNRSNTQTLRRASDRDFTVQDETGFVILLGQIQACPWEPGYQLSATGEVKHHRPWPPGITPSTLPALPTLWVAQARRWTARPSLL